MINEEQCEKGRLRALKWRAENPEKSRASSRRWREKNRERYNAVSRAWREKHAEEQKVWFRDWNRVNAERKRETDAAWRDAHRDELRRKSRDRYYRLRGIPPEERPVRDEAAIEAWRAEFARRWDELIDRLGTEGLLSRLAVLMRKERRR